MFKPFHTISMINPKRRSAGSPAKNMQESTLNAIVQNTNYTVTLEESGDDLVLPIPEELLTKAFTMEYRRCATMACRTR